MPMQTWEEMLGFGPPVTRSEIPRWLFAQTIRTPEGAALLGVYRSAWLADDDRMYQHVREVIERSHSEELMRYTVEDPQMVFGRGEWILYLLTERFSVPCPLNPATARLLEICRTYDYEADPVHPIHANIVCLEAAIHARLAAEDGSEAATEDPFERLQ